MSAKQGGLVVADVDPTDTIQQNASDPRKASTDATMAEQHSIPDQIAADKYRAGKQAMGRHHLGLRRIKLEPPGSV